MVENEFLVNREKVFKECKHVVVIKEEERAENVEGWEGRMNYLRTFIKGEAKKTKDKLEYMDVQIKRSNEVTVQS